MHNSTSMTKLQIAIALELIAATVPAQAADRRPPDPQLETVEVFGQRIEGLGLASPASTGSRLGLAPLDTPASVEVLDGEIIRQRGDLNIVEAVTRGTGITSEASPGDGGTALSTRGFVGHSSVMQLFDGTRLFVGAGTVTFPFDTWNVERVEVLRGPASVMYGQGAIGGVINVVPRRPDTNAHHAEAEVSFGEDQRRHAAMDLTGPINSELAYRFDVSRNEADNWVARGESDSLAVSGTLAWQPADELRLTLASDYSEQNPMRYFGTPLIDGRLDASLRGQNYNVADAAINYRDWWSRAKAEWQIAPGVLITNELYYLKTDRHWRNVEEYSFDTATPSIERASYIEILHHQRQTGDHFDVKFSHDIAGHDNTLAVGFDANQIRFTHVNNGPYGGSSSVGLFGFDPGINEAGTTPRFRTDTEQYSLFLEDRFELTSQWALTGGARYDSNKLERRNLVSNAVFDQTFSNTSWRVGVVYQPVESLSFYGQYATAVDPLGSVLTLSQSLASFDLATGRQIEIGVKQSLWDHRLEWTLAAYRIVKEDLLTQDPSTPNPDAVLQVGQQSSKGIEASIALNVTEQWRIEANVAALDARFDDFSEGDELEIISYRGNTPTSVPERTANLWLTWSPLEQWRARGGVRYVGKRYLDNANELELPSYAVVDTAVDWAPKPSLLIGATLRNVTDKVYAVTAYGASQWILGQPRTFELQARYRF
jgi:iron complex outermembrane recepter protein